MTGVGPTAARVRQAEGIEAPRIDAAAFRQGWRVRTRLDGLLSDGRISAEVWQAAAEYRNAWGRVLAAGGRSPGASRYSGGADRHDGMLGRLDLLTRLRQAETAMGRAAAALAYACAVEDRSWSSIGATWQRNPETVRDWTAKALHALAAAWPGTRPGRLGL